MREDHDVGCGWIRVHVLPPRSTSRNAVLYLPVVHAAERGEWCQRCTLPPTPGGEGGMLGTEDAVLTR